MWREMGFLFFLSTLSHTLVSALSTLSKVYPYGGHPSTVEAFGGVVVKILIDQVNSCENAGKFRNWAMTQTQL